MKKINIGEMIKNYDGSLIMNGQVPLTFRTVLMAQVGSHTGTTGEEMIRIRAVGQKIYDCKDGIIELEDADFQVVKASLLKPQFTALIMGPVWEMINSVQYAKNKNVENGK